MVGMQEGQSEGRGERAALRRGSVRGLVASFGGQGLRLIISVGQLVVLSRLLPPELFGVFGMTWAVLSIVYNCKDLGLASALVQKEGAEEQGFLEAAFWLSLLGGLALAALVIVAGRLLAMAYAEPLVAETCLKLSPMFAIGGVTSHYQALMRRRMQFVRLNVLMTIAQVVGTGGAILLALAGRGLDALVFQTLGQELCCLVLQPLFCRWRPRSFRISAPGANLVSFGGNLSFFRIVQNISSMFDHLSLGLFTNPAVVGLYNRAQTLFATPRRQLVQPLGQVMPPILARLQGDGPAFAAACSRLFQGTGYFWFAFLALPLAVPGPTLALVLGGQWEGAALMLRILAIGELARIPLSLLNMAETQLGRVEQLRNFALWSGPLTGLALMGGAWAGAETGMSIGYAISQNLLLVIRVWQTGGDTPLGPWMFLRSMCGPMLLFLLLVPSFWFGGQLGASEEALVSFFSALGTGALIIMALALFPKVRRGVREQISSFRGASSEGC